MSFEHEGQPSEERSLLEDARWVSVNGARLTYVERGTGDPVVFVHGGISDLTVWEPLLGPVGRGYRAIAYSRRYAWPNEAIPDGRDDQMLPHVDDLIAFIEALSLGPVHLVGNSWGAFICLLAALQRPDLVRSMVLQEPPVLPLLLGAPPRPWKLLGLLATRPATGRALLRMVVKGVAPAVKTLKRGRLEESVEIFARRVALGDAAYDALPEHFKAHMILNAGTHRAQFLGKGFPAFPVRVARTIATATLVMTGGTSPEGLRRLSQRLFEVLPNAQHVEIAEASHVMQLGNPHATADAIMAFLSRGRSPGTADLRQETRWAGPSRRSRQSPKAGS